MAYMEADAVEVGVKMVQDPTAIKYEGWLQHLLVNRFIVQFLWWKQILSDDAGVDMRIVATKAWQSLLSCAWGRRADGCKHYPSKLTLVNGNQLEDLCAVTKSIGSGPISSGQIYTHI